MSKTKLKNTLLVKNLVLAGLFIALGVLFPIFFHIIPNGRMLSPMHLPVFIAGLILGPQLGLVVGIVTPLLSSVLTGMPPIFPVALSMAVELGCYGLMAGLVLKFTKNLKTRNIVKIYIALISSQIIGRIVAGIFSAILLTITGDGFAFSAYLTSYFVSALPAIAIQLVFVPPVTMALIKILKIPVFLEKTTN